MPPEAAADQEAQTMIAELGHLALILALIMALVQSILPLLGAHLGHGAWMGLARPAARGQSAVRRAGLRLLDVWPSLPNDFSVLLARRRSNFQFATGLPHAQRYGATTRARSCCGP